MNIQSGDAGLRLIEPSDKLLVLMEAELVRLHSYLQPTFETNMGYYDSKKLVESPYYVWAQTRIEQLHAALFLAKATMRTP